MITIFAFGYIGANAELSVTPKAKELANFRLGSRNRLGETDWLKCSLWGELAPEACQLRKQRNYRWQRSCEPSGVPVARDHKRSGKPECCY